MTCVLWGGLYHITGTDIVRALVFRFEAFGAFISLPQRDTPLTKFPLSPLHFLWIKLLGRFNYSMPLSRQCQLLRYCPTLPCGCWDVLSTCDNLLDMIISNTCASFDWVGVVYPLDSDTQSCFPPSRNMASSSSNLIFPAYTCLPFSHV